MISTLPQGQGSKKLTAYESQHNRYSYLPSPRWNHFKNRLQEVPPLTLIYCLHHFRKVFGFPHIQFLALCYLIQIFNNLLYALGIFGFFFLLWSYHMTWLWELISYICSLIIKCWLPDNELARAWLVECSTCHYSSQNDAVIWLLPSSRVKTGMFLIYYQLLLRRPATLSLWLLNYFAGSWKRLFSLAIGPILLGQGSLVQWAFRWLKLAVTCGWWFTPRCLF